MLYDMPRLLVQQETDELFWIGECEQVACIDWELHAAIACARVSKDKKFLADSFLSKDLRRLKAAKAYADVPYAREPELDDYRRALDGDVASTPEKQRYLLIRFWWAANDPVRDGETSTSSVQDFRERLMQLRALLDTTGPDQCLMSAEAARQLGDFATAGELMNFQFPDGYSRTVALISKLIDDRDSVLREVTA